jgi:uncharacterized protein (TIGR02246 family)
MKEHLNVAGRILGVALLVAWAAHLPLKAQAVPEAEFQKLADDFSAAWAKGDAKGIAALHSKDAVRMTGDSGAVAAGAAIVGTAAIEKAMSDALSGPFKGTKLMIKAQGYQRVTADTFIGHGTYEISGGAPPPGTPTRGQYMNAMVREGGRWRIAASAVMPAVSQK